MPPATSRISMTTESAIYIPYRILADVRILGTSFAAAGPVDSARRRCRLLPPAIGRIRSMNTNTPIPPIQCVKLLQNKRPCPSGSTSDRIVAPVVVNPETVSKNASIYPGIAPLITNGSAPNALNRIQDNATIANPSFT